MAAFGPLVALLAVACSIILLPSALTQTIPPSIYLNAAVVPEVLKPGVGDTFFQYCALLFPNNLYSTSPYLYTRYQAVTGIAAYEAFAAYDRTAHGLLFGTQYKRPSSENTFSNKRIAACYAIYTVGFTLFGNVNYGYFNFENFQLLFTTFGFDPLANSTDVSTPIGLGRTVGLATASYFLNDDFNQLGYLGGRQYNPRPFQEVSDFVPVNTAYELKDPTRWQPLKQVELNLREYVQQFNGQGLKNYPPFTYYKPQQFQRYIGEPTASYSYASKEYIQQAQDVLHLSATLNDTTKCYGLFSQGSAGVVVFHVANKYNWTLDDQIKANFLIQLGFLEGSIAAFYYKGKYNAVRPETVIRFTGLFKKIKAWGGPYNPTVTMNASDWAPYLAPTPPEPEYPSGATCRDASIAQILRDYTGSDDLGWDALFLQGSSYLEPGYAPSQDTTIHFPTLTSVAEGTAYGRQTGGYHFKAATQASISVCNPIAHQVYLYGKALFEGKTPQKLGHHHHKH